ncbi:MAG: NUDIX hydrolase [Eubacteriales bacterium]|nr:NUDIX hydrolase [Eubacteriales bacterium]MDD4475571.1 NUDIX hydrolase [Eubacteriales bacterium]
MIREKVDSKGLTEAEFLAQYDASVFERPSVTVDVAAFRLKSGRPQILLIKRGGHPFIGKWALPGGFVESDETAEAAAVRELEEETGIKSDGIPLCQLRVFSEPKRDPRTRIITIAYTAILPEDTEVKAGDDAADGSWFDIGVMRLNKSETKLILSNNNISLTATVEVKNAATPIPGDASYNVIGDSEIASDHAAIITCAIDKLSNLLSF